LRDLSLLRALYMEASGMLSSFWRTQAVAAPWRQKYRKASATADDEKTLSLKESNSCMFFSVVARLFSSFNNNNLRNNSI